jgi:enoyl-CoA hydratase/carnithine racemase
VLFETVDGIAPVTLNRPEASNSIDLAAARELGDAVTAAAADDVRGVLLTGSGHTNADGPKVALGDKTSDGRRSRSRTTPSEGSHRRRV